MKRFWGMLRGKKEGQFRTIDGRVVFMGGPGSGGGGVSGLNKGSISSHYRAPGLDKGLVQRLQSIGPWDAGSAASELGVATWASFSRDADRWVRGADPSAKEDVQQWLEQDPQLRTLTLYGAWSSAANKGEEATFEEWLDKPQTLYRGGGASFPFMSFAPNPRIAHDASGGQGVWQVITPPRNWLGASQSGSGEVWIEAEAFEAIPPGTFLK